jgi:helicase
MLTSEFKYLTFPFAEFNPPQSEAIKLVENDCNLIAALNTSTGKTAIAMAFFAHELNVKNETKCIYTSPLKAISEERIADFANVREWDDIVKVINTGDYFAKPDDFEKARLVVVTSETLDSKCRNEKLHGEWLKKTGVLVLDEMHLLDEKSRGAALENAIVNFTRINNTARLVGLSATMSNAKEIGSWLKSLNGKPTYVVSSDWRPVKIKLHWVGVDTRKKWQGEKNMIDSAISVVYLNEKDKTLIFVHSKRIGYVLCDEIVKRGYRCYFYHAGLKKDQRNFLEREFKNTMSGLNVLVTTSALAMGVNL